MARNLLVIGGGAAGFFAALAAAEADSSCRITILERSAHLLAKVRVSGGGRCNVTHACFDPVELTTFYPRGGPALLGAFTRFQPQNTVEWFESRGVAVKTEADGRIFPVTNQSQTVIDCLRGEAERQGITVTTNVLIDRIDRLEGGFELALAGDRRLSADRVILATGSSALGWSWAKALGHRIEKPVPSLFTLTVHDPRLAGLSGLSVPKAVVALAGSSHSQRGPLLITHWGLSGPAVLKLSAWAAREFHAAAYEAKIVVNWVGEPGTDSALEALRRHRQQSLRKKAHTQPAFPVPLRLWDRLVSAAGIEAWRNWADVSNAQLASLGQELTQGTYQMRGKGVFKEEFVTCGGVHLDEVDFRTMESKRCRGLYFAGEILDVDGVTGGFNFQNAWTTGWIAGRSAAGAQN